MRECVWAREWERDGRCWSPRCGHSDSPLSVNEVNLTWLRRMWWYVRSRCHAVLFTDTFHTTRHAAGRECAPTWWQHNGVQLGTPTQASQHSDPTYWTWPFKLVDKGAKQLIIFRNCLSNYRYCHSWFTCIYFSVSRKTNHSCIINLIWFIVKHEFIDFFFVDKNTTHIAGEPWK